MIDPNLPIGLKKRTILLWTMVPHQLLPVCDVWSAQWVNSTNFFLHFSECRDSVPRVHLHLDVSSKFKYNSKTIQSSLKFLGFEDARMRDERNFEKEHCLDPTFSIAHRMSKHHEILHAPWAPEHLQCQKFQNCSNFLLFVSNLLFKTRITTFPVIYHVLLQIQSFLHFISYLSYTTPNTYDISILVDHGPNIQRAGNHLLEVVWLHHRKNIKNCIEMSWLPSEFVWRIRKACVYFHW